MRSAIISLAAGAFILCCGAAVAFSDDDSSTHTVFVEFGSTTW